MGRHRGIFGSSGHYAAYEVFVPTDRTTVEDGLFFSLFRAPVAFPCFFGQ